MKRPTTRQVAEIALGILLLIIIRSLGEYFRLRYALGDALTFMQITPYIVGALFAAISLGISALCYRASHYRLSIGVAVAAVVALFVYKVAVIG
jgi:hypothetical protein